MSAAPEAPDVVRVVVVGPTRLLVELEDGRRGVFDAAPWLHLPAFAALRDCAYFSRVRVQHGVLSWPGEEDFAPETVAARLEPVASAAR